MKMKLYIRRHGTKWNRGGVIDCNVAPAVTTRFVLGDDVMLLIEYE